MKIKVAFFKGEGSWKNKVIRWWTTSPFSHVELILPDEKTWISISPFLTSRVAARHKEQVNHSNWEFIEIEVTEQQVVVIKEFYEFTEGCRYDWIGMLLSQFLPFHIKRRNKWYCSEWIAYALRISCVIDWKLIKIYDRCDLSPAVLYSIITATPNDKV
jgi:hypothetical protein|tara:strand:- start:3146 stop:3622 length:477 start_codon:yes stop_codon:yes gene_type:complete